MAPPLVMQRVWMTLFVMSGCVIVLSMWYDIVTNDKRADTVFEYAVYSYMGLMMLAPCFSARNPQDGVGA